VSRLDILHMLAALLIERGEPVPTDILAELEELGQDISQYA
jgi:hypothetical protein